MSNQQDLHDPPQRRISDGSQRHDTDIWMKTYRYLRTAMVLLLVALGIAVIYESLQNKLLDSVSAYYYTPAQAIFVGALIGLGACMLALKGTTPVEDVVLNLGGIFAAVVAVVPTSRGPDFEDAISACAVRKRKASRGLDCDTLTSLQEAARSNIENNMFALLVIVSLAVIAAFVFVTLDRREDGRRQSWLALVAGAIVVIIGWVTFYSFRGGVIRNAHWVAAFGLFLCIFVVAFENARRHLGPRLFRRAAAEGPPQPAGRTVSHAGAVLIKDVYAVIALLLLGAGVVAVVAWLGHWINLFWLEIIVFLLFIAFWFAQTIEQGTKPPATEPPARR